MTNKVYVVTSGEYSEYTVEAIFKAKEVAEQYCKNIGYGDVQEMDVIESLPEPIWLLEKRASISQDKISAQEDELTAFYTGIGETSSKPHKFQSQQWVTPYLPEPHIVVLVSGTDHERVNKVFSEKTKKALARFDILVADERAKYGGEAIITLPDE